jgi:signal peptidase II
VLTIIVVDQISKLWAVSYLYDKTSVEVLGRFVMLTLVYNQGGALGTNFGSGTYYLVSSLIILAVVFYYLVINWEVRSIGYPLACIAGGAIGNIIDRIRLGKVIDFVDIDFFDINLLGYRIDRWWTFNVADAAISCSIVFLLLHILFARARHKPDSPPPAEV